MRSAAIILVIATLAVSTADAEGLAAEARSRNAPPVAGELTLNPRGGFQFRAATRPVPVESVGSFRPARSDFTPRQSSIPLRVHLLDRQALTGHVVRCDAETIVVRTVWAESIAVPRFGAERIALPDGWRLVFADSFERDEGDWKMAGKPKRSDADATAGKHSLVLDAPSQRAVYELPEPVAAGRIVTSIRQPGAVKGCRWFVELEFVRAKMAPAIVRVEVAGPGAHFDVHSIPKPEYRSPVRRTMAWRRLSIEFAPNALRVFVDEHVAWAQSAGPGGKLTICRLTCAAEANGPSGGEVRFDDFAVLAAVAPKRDRAPRADAAQDAVVSRDGDTLFGRVAALDREGITLESSFGKRRLPWTEAAGATFRRQAVAGRSTDGEHVRLTLRGGDGLRDVLDGAVKSLTGRHMVLSHALLGDLTIPAAAIEEIRPRFFGQEVVIDAGPHHLGKKTRAAFVSPKAEGLSLIRRFRVDRLDGDATMVIAATHVVGAADGPDVAAALKRGGMQTAVFINDKRAGCLNDFVDRSSTEIKSIRIPIAKELLVVGANAVELRQTIDPETGGVAEIEVQAIRIELPRSR